jgi:hypothetical protein
MKDLQGIAAKASWLQLLLLLLLLPLVQLFSPKSLPPLCCRKSRGICPERCDFLSSASRLRNCHDHEQGLMKQANRIEELLVAYSPLPPQRHKNRKLRTASEDSFKVQSPRPPLTTSPNTLQSG